MKLLKSLYHQRRSHPLPSNGFGMSEAVVAAGAGILLIGASSLALRSTQTLIDRAESKATLRQNTTNGLRLLRSEIERSLHILVNNSDGVPPGMEHTDMANEQYQDTVEECGQHAEARNQIFKPVFGIKMDELNTPVLYGLSVNSNQAGYALLRCGAPLSLDGRYSETEDVFIAKAIEDIGVMNCTKLEGDCEPLTNDEGEIKSLREIIEGLDVTFTADKTPQNREFKEPAFALETDEKRKLVKFIDPNTTEYPNKKYDASYLQATRADDEITSYPLYLAAFARADKRPEQYGHQPHHHLELSDSGSSADGALYSDCEVHTKNNEPCHSHTMSDHDHSNKFDGAYFRNVSSKRIRFLVDGSGSMSACILWGSTYGKPKIYWLEDEDIPYGGYYYLSTKNCALTRMESLQRELTSLITSLSPDTKISIQSFSSPGRKNHKGWKQSSDSLIKIGDQGMRESAIAFVNSLDNGRPTKWGATYPWEGLNASFEDNETDTLYFLSDGDPTADRMGGSWQANDHEPTVAYYSNFNNTRKQVLKINTIALGLESPWMEKLSTNTTGDHLQIDKDYVTTNSSQ